MNKIEIATRILAGLVQRPEYSQATGVMEKTAKQALDQTEILYAQIRAKEEESKKVEKDEKKELRQSVGIKDSWMD